MTRLITIWLAVLILMAATDLAARSPQDASRSHRQGPEATQTHHIYVAVVEDGTIAAINTATLEVDWILQVSHPNAARAPEAAMGIAASLGGTRIYAGDAATNELVVVDAKRREVITRLAIGHELHSIDLSADGRFLWVDGGLDEYPWLTRVTTVDVANFELRPTSSPALERPAPHQRGFATHPSFTPDGQELWTASVTTDVLWVWGADTGKILAVVNVRREDHFPEAKRDPKGFNEVALSPDGARAYAVAPGASLVYAIEVATRKVIGAGKVGEGAHGIAVTRDNSEVWVTGHDGVTILAPESLEVMATIDLATCSHHVSFSIDGRHAYVSKSREVAVIDVATKEVIRRIAVGKEPHEFSLKNNHGPQASNPVGAPGVD